MPKAMSRPRLPVEMCSTFMVVASPSFITLPLPNCFSIWLMAVSRAFFFSSLVKGCWAAAVFWFFCFAAIMLSLLQ